MKRIRGKLLMVMLLGILLTAVLVGGVSVLSLRDILQLDSEAMLARSTQEFAEAVNDSYGHLAGDLLLMQAASLIQQHFPDEKVYRIGGDEFAIVFRNRPRYFVFSMLTEFRKRMRDSVSQDIRIPVVASGLADYDENLDAAFQDVFARADHAMYENKLALKQLDPETVQAQNRDRP